MAAPYLIQSDVPVSRTITLTARWLVGDTDVVVNDSCFPVAGDPITVSWPRTYAVKCSGRATIAKAGWAADPLISVSWGWDMTRVQGTMPDPMPDPCPHTYEASTGWDETISTFKTLEATFYHPSGSIVWNPSDVAGGVYTQDILHSMECHDGNIYTEIDEEATITLSISGVFDLVAVPDTLSSVGSPHSFVQDHDPYGLESQHLEIKYRPKGTVTLTVTAPHGTHTETLDVSDFSSQAAFEGAFEYGFGCCTVGATSSSAGSEASPSALVEMLTGQFGGSGFPGSSAYGWDSYASASSPNDIVYYNPGTGAFRAVSDCVYTSPDFSPVIESVKGAFGVTYSATGADFAGGTRSGSAQTYECHNYNASPREYMSVALGSSATYQSRGHYYLESRTVGSTVYGKRVADYWAAGEDPGGVSGAREYRSWHGYTNEDKTAANTVGGLQNLAGMGEPSFPPATGETYEKWYDDSRCDVQAPYDTLAWADAAIFTIAAEVTLANLGTSATWTVTDGAANITYSGGRMHVEVTSAPCTITRAVDEWLTGARLVELDYEGDDTDPIELSLESSTWDVTPDAATVDVIAAKGRSDGDATQLSVSGNGWAGGLNHVTTLALGGLRAGQTYSFGTVKGKRLTQAQGGFTSVQVTNEGFRGTERGDNVNADPYTGTRSLILLVDGIYAGEAGTGAIGSASWLSPGSHGLVTLTHGTGAAEWQDEAEVDAYHLTPGVYTGYASVTVPARFKAATITFPSCYNLPTTALSALKRLRGGINIITGEPGELPAVRRVLVELGGSTVLDLTTNAAGYVYAGPLQQPLDGTANLYTVKVEKEDASWLSETVETRNRSASQVTFVGVLADVALQSALAVVQSKRTGRTYLADNALTGVMLRIYDHTTSAHTAERRVTAAASATGVGISYIDGRTDSIAVYYDESGTIKRVSSTDEGRTWGAAVSIATGTYPQAAYSPAEQLEMCCYLNASNQVCVKRKLGTGNWGSEIVIAAGTSGDVAAITPLLGERTSAWVVFVKSSGSIRRYKSTDAGRTWALDE